MKCHPQTYIPLRPNLGVLQIGIKSQDIVMSDLEDSTVTYMAAPSSPDYVPGPEEPEHEFVPEPVYPEFMPPEDDVLPAKEQPLPTAISPTADSPGYISFDDDEDDDDDVEEDEDEEEEHPAPSDSVPPPVHRVTARMCIRDEPPTPFWYEAEISRLLAKPSPPPSPLSPLSSPLPQIPSPPLPVLSPVPVSPPPLPASPTYPLGYRAAMIRQRDDRIVDWKTYTLTENFMYYQIFRGDGSSKNYKILSEMLEDFDRQDVEELYILVKERFSVVSHFTDAVWYSHTYANREEIPSKSRDDFQDVEKEIGG
ncbi:hypothetical protein Tco_0011204 [Tanacetum coccineum]